MLIKVIVSLFPLLSGLVGGAIAGAVTVHYIAPDPMAGVRADQAPVQKQAQRDIDNMKRELRQHKQSGSSSSWR